MIELVPKELFFTKGVGKHREKLTSFELALRSAGIAACNLVAGVQHLSPRLSDPLPDCRRKKAQARPGDLCGDVGGGHP